MVIYIQPVSNSDYFTHPFSTLINTQGLLHCDWTILGYNVSHQDKNKIAIGQDLSKNALIFDTLFFSLTNCYLKRSWTNYTDILQDSLWCQAVFTNKISISSNCCFQNDVQQNNIFWPLSWNSQCNAHMTVFSISLQKDVPTTTFEQLLNQIFGNRITIMKQFYTTSKTICFNQILRC